MIQKLKCLRCENAWIPRVENPKQCPACKSLYWNKHKVGTPQWAIQQSMKQLGQVDPTLQLEE